MQGVVTVIVNLLGSQLNYLTTATVKLLPFGCKVITGSYHEHSAIASYLLTILTTQHQMISKIWTVVGSSIGSGSHLLIHKPMWM